MRLIDADALNTRKYTRWFSCPVDERQVERMIREAPTIDAVPVVRCVDCKYRELAKVNYKGYIICPASGMEITDYDYCSYGERKEEAIL